MTVELFSIRINYKIIYVRAIASMEREAELKFISDEILIPYTYFFEYLLVVIYLLHVNRIKSDRPNLINNIM
jgi:hypothetical protein